MCDNVLSLSHSYMEYHCLSGSDHVRDGVPLGLWAEKKPYTIVPSSPAFMRTNLYFNINCRDSSFINLSDFPVIKFELMKQELIVTFIPNSQWGTLNIPGEAF